MGVLRGKGELHVTGNHDIEAMDLDKSSVTTLTNLQDVLENLQKGGDKKQKPKETRTHMGVVRGKGELHISGNHDIEAMDLDKTSVTHLT